MNILKSKAQKGNSLKSDDQNLFFSDSGIYIYIYRWIKGIKC
jgi:hypothetical protein